MTSTTLVKALLHNSVADSVYKEVTSKSERYYYFLGRVLDWDDINNPPFPVDSLEYENDTRRNIVIVKEIQPSDVAYVVNRVNWTSGTVYDMYDDAYSRQVAGINLSSGGSGYSSSNTTVTISGGGGSGATAANATVANGIITSIVLTNQGDNYTSAPNVVISGNGIGATANAVMSLSYSGASNLQSANYFVVTDNFNIYKCLDNNNNAESTVKPADVSTSPFITNDGYKWKFMGSVPVSSRNKFLSTTQIPVTTALNNQFYSGGEIKSINVLDTGNNYTYASIVVQGDGYLEDDPVLIINANVNVQGTTSYSYANVTIEPPVAYSESWSSSTAYNAGKIFIYENNIYEVIQGGTTSTNPPVHTKGIAKNGTAILKYRGTGITANATLTGSYVTGLSNLYGMVRDIVITNNGSGYIAAPEITISGDGSNATATAYILNNTVSRIEITNSGKNFTTAPVVTIGTQWTANANMLLNSQVFHNTRLYTVSTGGYANTTAPTHTSGTQTLGNAAFTFAGTKATAYARLKYGSGYTRAPNVTITGDGSGANITFQAEKTEAILYPYIQDGKITQVLIENGGIGYTYATLTVVGDGTNAEFEVNFSRGDLDSLQSTNELLAVPGAIHAIKVLSRGYGYTGANVTITGNGTGATANATIINGRVTKVNVITEGTGYTYANVIITPVGAGAGATAKAILPPKGGHGKDTTSELFAKSLAFYGTLATEKNQGFVVTNDYRQFGIIKEIKNYNNNRFFNQSVGSGCWLLSGNINSTLFAQDTLITRSSDNAEFLIISSNSTGMIVISLKDQNPTSGDFMIEPTGNSFIVTGVTDPDIDKYSGELLYIDNRKAFSTSDDQLVSLKTVFKY